MEPSPSFSPLFLLSRGKKGGFFCAKGKMSFVEKKCAKKRKKKEKKNSKKRRLLF
jgi:hypothetical protein